MLQSFNNKIKIKIKKEREKNENFQMNWLDEVKQQHNSNGKVSNIVI